jgi:PAS domain S-box-containing protein/putative nucleotidyltransferase with HDIG domain
MSADRDFLNTDGIFTGASATIQDRGVDYWRESILNYTLSLLVVLGILVLVPSIWRSSTLGLSGEAVLNFLAYGFVLSLLVFRRIHYRLRAIVFVVVGLAVGVISFYMTADEGTGLFWLFVVPPLAGLLLGLRSAAIFYGINIFIVVATGFVIVSQNPLFPRLMEFNVESWTVYGLNFLVTNGLVTLPLALLLNGLLNSTEENARLLRETTSANDQLRISDQILQNVTSLVMVLDSDGLITFASPSTAKTIGYPAEELLGDGWWRLTRTKPEDAVREREELRRMIRGEIPLITEPYERKIITRSGETRWIEWQDTLAPNQTLIGAGRDITEQKLAEIAMARRLSQLRILTEIDRAILTNFDLKSNLQILASRIVPELGIDAANIMIYHPTLQSLEGVASFGFMSNAFDGRELQLGEGYAGKAAEEKKLVHIRNLNSEGSTERLAQALAKEPFKTYFGFPLIAKGEVRGVLELFARKPFEADEDWFSLAEAFASRAAIAIDTVKVFENLQRSNAELILSYNAAIEGWSRALDLRDKETEGHSQRVTELGMRLAKKMNLTPTELNNFRRGALLHDIGKMGVPDSILLKPGKLTDEEWLIMKQHTNYARDMLSGISYLSDAMDIPYAHHEKWDGNGYPTGLKAEQIPLAARIFAVADVYDALTSDRPYRKAWTKQETVEYIRKESGKHFDPTVVTVFLSLVREPTGMLNLP